MAKKQTISPVIRAIDKLSGYTFFLGLITSKVQYFPPTVITPFANILTLALYLLGYSLWFISSHFYPEQKRSYREWYGFAKFKEQHIYAAAIGISAAVISVTALALPALLIPAGWLFFISNTIWTISEYHKFKNPPRADPKYSRSHQTAYFSYAVTLTTMSFAAALAATLIFAFPPIGLTVLTVSAVVATGLTLLAAQYWLSSLFGNHKKSRKELIADSYQEMAVLTTQKGHAQKARADRTDEPEHTTRLFTATTPQRAEVEEKQPLVDDERINADTCQNAI